MGKRDYRGEYMPTPIVLPMYRCHNKDDMDLMDIHQNRTPELEVCGLFKIWTYKDGKRKDLCMRHRTRMYS